MRGMKGERVSLELLKEYNRSLEAEETYSAQAIRRVMLELNEYAVCSKCGSPFSLNLGVCLEETCDGLCPKAF